MTAQKPDDRQLLRQVIEEAFDKPTWNGTNFRSSISRIGADKAAWVPPHAKHNIADITLHCAYWKYAIGRQLSGAAKGGFPRPGTNWFRTPRPVTLQSWSECRALLDEQHKQLCLAITNCKKRLNYSDASSRELVRKIYGVAIHDAYHTGQVHLILAQFRRSHRQ